MLVTVLGTPTAYGYWGFTLVGEIMNAVYGAHRRIHCLDLAELRAGWSVEKDLPVLVTSDRPDTALSYILITSGCPILAFFDDPRDALLNAIVSDNLPACTRHAQTLQGLPRTFSRAPMPEASPAQQAAIARALEGLDALNGKRVEAAE